MGIGKSASHTGCGLTAQVPIHSRSDGTRGCDWTNKYDREHNGHDALEDVSSWLLIGPSMRGGRNLGEHLQPPCFGDRYGLLSSG